MKSDIRKQFADRVIQLRKDKGFSQESFAFATKIDRSYMGKIERGQVSIGIIQIEKIAKTLEIDVYKLFLFE